MERFQLVVDGVPYIIKSIPFHFNDDLRFLVALNDGPEHIFTWDSSLGRVTAVDDESSTIPDSLEQAIAERLQTLVQ